MILQVGPGDSLCKIKFNANECQELYVNRPEYIYGYHTIKALLDTQPDRIIKIYLQENRQDQRSMNLLEQAQDSGIEIMRISRREIEQIIDSQAPHQGMLAECKPFSGFDESALQSLLAHENQPQLLLLLDGLQDPHNLGACVRSANAFGVHAVLAPKNRAVGLTSVVRKVASGATAITPFVQVTNLVRTIQQLQQEGMWVIGMTDKGDSELSQLDLTGNVAIVMGAEGSGLRALTKKHCDYLACIPMQGNVDSLNVSVATGIALYEVQRQRFLKVKLG